MKKLTYIFNVVLIILTIISCTDDRDTDFLEDTPLPTNVGVTFSVSQDNTGTVSLIPTADGANSFTVDFGDGSEIEATKIGEVLEHTYTEGSYEVTVVALNIIGDATTYTETLNVSFKAPENLDVVIENDAATSKQVNITVNADFAIMYEFYSGEDGITEPVATANIGNSVSYTYTEAGTYTVKIIVKGAAIETTEYTQEFEVTEILQPIAPASNPPTRAESDVVSIFSDAYTQTTVDLFVTDWSAVTAQDEITIDGNQVLVYSELSFAGIITESQPIDASSMEYFHFDIWTNDVTTFKTKFVDFNGTGYNNGADNIEYELEHAISEQGQWISFDIPISDYDGVPFSDINQMVISAAPAGTVFLDNMYFWKESEDPFDDGLLINGTFDNGSDSWTVGTGTDPVNVITVDGNSYYSADVASAGNAWEVNMSQKVGITQSETYTLIFKAWSDRDRSIIAGIGLSASPWSSATETVAINTTPTTYSLTLTATDFGAPDARVLFDLGADAGQVNIDDVALFLGNGPFDDGLLTNGTFEHGSAPWIEGTDDNKPANVVTDGGNSYYSANVASAGNPWEVNVSQKLEITQGATYTLSFDAWSDVNRSVIAGIGLSGDPWSSDTEVVQINTSRNTYSITVSATDFGAANARVLFDLGDQVGQVNIDNVSLVQQ